MTRTLWGMPLELIGLNNLTLKGSKITCQKNDLVYPSQIQLDVQKQKSCLYFIIFVQTQIWSPALCILGMKGGIILQLWCVWTHKPRTMVHFPKNVMRIWSSDICYFSGFCTFSSKWFPGERHSKNKQRKQAHKIKCKVA